MMGWKDKWIALIISTCHKDKTVNDETIYTWCQKIKFKADI